MQWTPLQRKRLLYISRTNRPGCLLMARNVPQDLHKMHSISLLQKHPIHKSSKFRANQSLKEWKRILFICWNNSYHQWKEGAWKRQEEEEAVAQSAGSAQSWLLTMILGARTPRPLSIWASNRVAATNSRLCETQFWSGKMPIFLSIFPKKYCHGGFFGAG